MHVGEPKTGTTFLQQIMWQNRAALTAQGLALPGHGQDAHYRAGQDIRGVEQPAADPAGPWPGEWEVLAGQARHARTTSVISAEHLAALDPEQVDRAIASLQPADVHVVITVRDMARLLPAEWQETVKHRNTLAWEDWISGVIERESISGDRRRWKFWKVHDTVKILDAWSARLPADHVHVITVPPRGAAKDLLWRRFAQVLDVDPGSVDVSRARANSSLGMAETEFLRRLNQRLPADLPAWFYGYRVKEVIAHRAFAGRPAAEHLKMSADRSAWLKEYAEATVDSLRASGYDVVGDLDELRPPAEDELTVSPAALSVEQAFEAAVDGAVAMLVDHYHHVYPAARPKSEAASPKLARVDQRLSAAIRSPRVVRLVRRMSSRFALVRRLRVLAWRILQRRRETRAARAGVPVPAATAPTPVAPSVPAPTTSPDATVDNNVTAE